MSWDQELVEPIIVASVEPLRTLADCARHLSKLSRSERQAPEWQAVAEVLAQASRGGDLTLLRVVILAALLIPRPAAMTAPAPRRTGKLLAFARQA